jgi:hypothetical protein
MRTLKDGEEPEKPKKSYKAWKDKADAKAPAKKARKPAKKKLVLTDDEVKRLNELNNRTRDKQIAKEQQEAKVRAKLNLDENTPVPKAWVQGGPKFDLDAMQRFCEEYEKHNLVTKAAKAAGVSPSTVRLYLKTNPMFEEMVLEAKQVYRDKIVETVYERAVTGIEEPIIGGMGRDQVVAYKRIYSDRLLELEARRVEHGYRDKGGVEINTGGGVLVVQAGNMDEGDWEKKYGALQKGSE